MVKNVAVKKSEGWKKKYSRTSELRTSNLRRLQLTRHQNLV